MKLSARLRVFLEQSLRDKPLWDICCDHGYVGIAALKEGTFSEVHFVDQVSHIIKKLESILIAEDYSTPYYLHAIGAEGLNEKMSGTFLIAGVGGLTIKNIMSPLLKKELMQCERLLFSPQTDELVLVDFLASSEVSSLYELKEKILIPEGRRVRSLYVLDLRT